MCKGCPSGRRWHLCAALCVGVLAFIFMTAAGAGAARAAQPKFSAHGSVEQVYVTGANPGDQLTLVDSSGATVATHQVNDLGGALFRNVTPGSGYRVRGPNGAASDPLTVLTTSRLRRAPTSTTRTSPSAATST